MLYVGVDTQMYQ